MNISVTDLDGASLSPDFVLRLDQALAALEAQALVLHLWHTWREPLDAARDAVLQGLRARGHLTHVCPAGAFLPLLETLNTLIADSLREAPLPTAQQVGVWVVDGAQALQAHHADLIERVLTHFPELPLRLVLLSQTLLAPVVPGSAQVMEVAWCETEPRRPSWVPDDDTPLSADSAMGQAVLWLVVAAALALLVGGFWWALRDGRSTRTQLASDVAVTAASVPAVDEASDVMRPTSEPASAAPVAASAAPPAAAQASAPALVASASALQASAAQAVLAAASAPVAKAAPRSPLQNWVQGLPEGSFLVLHAQFASAREAEAFKAADPLLANARITQAVWVAGQPARYGVLTGPFRSSERVSNHMQRLAWRDQARSVSREALLALLSP